MMTQSEWLGIKESWQDILHRGELQVEQAKLYIEAVDKHLNKGSEVE